MKRSFVTSGALLFALILGCGGAETTGSPEAAATGEATPPVSAPSEGGYAPATPEAPTAAPATGADARRCLDLVRGGEYGEAIPACVSALDADPANQEVQAALDEARREATRLGRAVPSPDAAVEAGSAAAKDAAASKVDDAAGQLGDALGR